MGDLHRDGTPAKKDDEESLFLKENDGWLAKYDSPKKIRAKRVKMFADMEGIDAPP